MRLNPRLGLNALKAITGSTLASIVCLAALGLSISQPVRAQIDSGQSNDITIQVTKGDLRRTLRSVFSQAGVSYSISPEVQGLVTVRLRNVTLDNALNTILRQVDATYRIDGGTYQVYARDTTDIDSTFDNPTPRPTQPPYGQFPPTSSYTPSGSSNNGAPAIFGDSIYLYIVRGDNLTKVRKSDLKIVGRTNLSNVSGY